MHLLLFLYTTLFTFSFAKYTYVEQGHIINLGDPTWWIALNEFPQGLLVYFFEPSSLPCRQFWPEFHATAQSLYDLNSTIQVAKVDCYDEINFCKYLEVFDFPTIRLYRTNYPVYEFRGVRTAEALRDWVRKTVDFAYSTTIDNTNDLFERHSIAIVYEELIYSVNATYAEFFDRIEIAKAGESIKFITNGYPAAIVTQRSHIMRIGADMLAKDVKDEVNRLLYIDNITVPTIAWEEYIDIQKGMNCAYVVFFRTGNFDVVSEISKAFDEVAMESRSENLKFVYVNVKDDLIGFQLGRLFGINVDSESTIGIIAKKDSIMKKYKIENPQTVNADYLREFINDFNNGTLPRYLMSSDINKTPLGYIKDLVGKNYSQATTDPKLNVFVMLYSSLCENCLDLEAPWKALAYRMRSRTDIVIARIDMHENDIEEFVSVESPTLLFYPAGHQKEVIKYDSGKNINEFKKFLIEHIPDLEEQFEL